MTATSQRKRRQGRPVENAVGRDTLLATARRLLQEHPPARVTVSLIAREAGVDPALVRYYFGDRTKLLLAVVDSMMRETPMAPPGDAAPVEVLEASIRNTARFTRSTRHIHRLMVDELADAKSTDAGQKLGEMNLGAVDNLRRLMERDGGATLRQTDPVFLHLALIALFDFFISAEPVIRRLVPEGTDMDALFERYQDFASELVLDGLRRR